MVGYKTHRFVLLKVVKVDPINQLKDLTVALTQQIFWCDLGMHICRRQKDNGHFCKRSGWTKDPWNRYVLYHTTSLLASILHGTPSATMSSNRLTQLCRQAAANAGVNLQEVEQGVANPNGEMDLTDLYALAESNLLQAQGSAEERAAVWAQLEVRVAESRARIHRLETMARLMAEPRVEQVQEEEEEVTTLEAAIEAIGRLREDRDAANARIARLEEALGL